jgi:NAD(P)-dependent dehydrogenase (short-subunit alcohol dehydrogenase family)
VGAFVVREPLVPGDEASGVVEAIGSAVTRVLPGDRVAIIPSHPCGTCDHCRSGRGNLCRKRSFLGSAGVFPHAQGMFRQALEMGEAQRTPIAEAPVSLGEIACAEPLSIGLHALHRAGTLMGATVLVTGSGTVGCMSAMAARLAGAAHITVCNIHDRPLERARSVGADRVVRSDRIDLKGRPTAPLSPSRQPGRCAPADHGANPAGSLARSLPSGGRQDPQHQGSAHCRRTAMRPLGKTAFLTTAGQGIGRAVAEAFVREGARVIATNLNDSLLATLQGCSTQRLGAMDPAAIQAAAAHGPLDMLFSGAGLVHAGTVLDCTEVDWDFAFQLNVRSQLRSIKAFLPGMLGKGAAPSSTWPRWPAA